MIDVALAKRILADMFNVSTEANPNNFSISGKTTWKKFFDNKYGENPNIENIINDLKIYFDDITEEEALKIYNDPEELRFWVYDRYNDGSFILYTLYGDKNSKWETYEIKVNKMLPL